MWEFVYWHLIISGLSVQNLWRSFEVVNATRVDFSISRLGFVFCYLYRGTCMVNETKHHTLIDTRQWFQQKKSSILIFCTHQQKINTAARCTQNRNRDSKLQRDTNYTFILFTSWLLNDKTKLQYGYEPIFQSKASLEPPSLHSQVSLIISYSQADPSVLAIKTLSLYIHGLKLVFSRILWVVCLYYYTCNWFKV